ncbi:hypothetical protein [Streptomyces canus]|uniref:hypothetical protein n=1 Tax=Streptomyces canus TaxID=58343 RepID=UPI0038068259
MLTTKSAMGRRTLPRPGLFDAAVAHWDDVRGKHVEQWPTMIGVTVMSSRRVRRLAAATPAQPPAAADHEVLGVPGVDRSA